MHFAITQTTHAWLKIIFNTVLLYYSTDKDSATLCDDDGIRLHHALVYSVIPAGFFFLLCIVLIIVICVIVYINSLNFKKDTQRTEDFLRRIVENAEVKQPPIADDLQSAGSIPSGAQVRAQNDPPPADDEGRDTAVSQTDQQQATPTLTQRTLSVGSNSGTSSGRGQENGGVDHDQPDTGVNTPLLAQQQSVGSSTKSSHRDNPVYYLIKKSMKEAEFPERRYRRLKKKLRSTCEKCKNK